MNQLLESVTKDIDEQIEKLQAIKEDLSRWLPELPYDGTVFATGYGNMIEIKLPFDRNLMESIKLSLTAQDFDVYERGNAEAAQCNEGRQSFTLKSERSPHVSIVIEYNPYKDGSVCVRRQIGERTETRPVYEFVCKEALIEENKSSSQEV